MEADQCLSSLGNSTQKIRKAQAEFMKADQCSSAQNIENENACNLAGRCSTSSGNIENNSGSQKPIKKNSSSIRPSIEAQKPKLEISDVSEPKSNNRLGWGDRYEELKRYVKEFGHTRVPGKFADNPALGNWVKTQRKCHKNIQTGNPSCILTEERVQLLNEIGFEWSVHAASWNERYEELASYKKEFGHTRVPARFADNPGLGIWVHTQRKRHKNMQTGNPSYILTEERVQLLNEISFEWSVLVASWNEKYEELASYKREFGHTRVPAKFADNPAL